MRVNGVTTGAQLDPDVTALDDGGGWVVSWTSDQSGKPEIYQRRYTPTGLSLSQSEVTEKGDPFVGFLSPTTADGASIAWSLVDSAGGRFKITPGTNQLVVANAAAIDGDEGEDSYTITVKATAGGASETQTFKITRNDVDEKPVNLHLIGSGPVKIAENSNAGIAVMAVEAKDPENAAITYSLTANGGGAFKIDAATGVVSVADKTKLDYETNKTLDIEVKASDPAGNFVKAGFTVTIEDVDETVTPPGGGGTNNAPTGVSLSGASVDELALNGTVVGKLSAIDPDAMQTFSYQLSDDAGGRFVLLGDTLYVLNGVALDFEQAGAHQVTVVATDQGGLSKTQTLSIAVGDIHNEKSAGTGFADTLFGDYGKDVFSGGGGNDVLKGFKNADTLTGGAGNDRLFGGLGRDKLLGGKGKDVFVFDTKPASANVDTLKDFSHKDDTVWLENALFKGIGSGSLAKPKKMKADAFFLGKEAHDANDRILYDKAKGALWYDADGSGSHAAVKIAVLTTKPALTLSDFYVI